MIEKVNELQPKIASNAYVAHSADIIGAVQLEENTSVWHQAVLRADNDTIIVGPGSNIQDGAVVHVDPGFPCTIGKNCVIGHRAVLHGCTLGDGVLIGIGAIVLNGAKIPEGCLIGAGALVAEGKELEAGHLYMGIPAKKIRELQVNEKARILGNAKGYQERAALYLATASTWTKETL